MLMCPVICPGVCACLLESSNHICIEQNQTNLFIQAPSRLSCLGRLGEAASSLQGLQGSVKEVVRAATVELLTI